MGLTEKQLRQIYQDLHQIPELALEEYQTKAYLTKVIRSFDQSFLEIYEPEVLPTALLVLVKGFDPERTIGYRADIDALPVEEKTGLAYASHHPGVMHACGHDVHMTVALGLLAHFA